MNSDLIAGLNPGVLKPDVYALMNKKGPCPFEMAGKPRAPGAAADHLQLSEVAKTAYAGEESSLGKSKGFEDRFKDALLDFTKYALHLNGFTGAPTGKQTLMALHVLAKKSGIDMPQNINAGKEELLHAFKSEWGLSEDASTEEIYQQMIQAFGEDRSFGDTGPTVDPTTGTGAPFDSPVTDSNFKDALTTFTAQLFEKNGVYREPGPGDEQRVLNVLADKLGFEGQEDDLMNQVARALGVSQGASMQEILSAMARAFNM
jgi:hypothetical protein